MKKLVTILTIIFSFMMSYGQAPNKILQGAPSTEYIWRGPLASDSALVLTRNFPDTATANLGWLKGTPNAIIVVDDSLWKRSNDATFWMRVGSGSGGGGGSTLTLGTFLTGVSYDGTSPITTGIDTSNAAFKAYIGHYGKDSVVTIYTGDGNLSGNRIIDLDGNGIGFINGSRLLFELNPSVGDENNTLLAFNEAGENSAKLFQHATSTTSEFYIYSDFNDATKLAQIEGNANSTEATLEYTADIHTFDGHVLVSVLNTSGSALATSGTRQQVISDANGLLSFTNKTFAALTYGATTSWDYTTGYNKTLTLIGDANLVPSNVQDGDQGTLIIIQDGSGNHELTVPDQVITINTGAGDTTVLGFINQGGVYYWATSVATGGGGEVLTISSPLTGTSYDGSAPVSIGIQNAAADGSTKGAAAFNATYFDASSGVVNIDLTNGAASGSQGGYVTTGTQTFAGNKTLSGTTTIATPFTLGAVSVTSTGTQLNYLNSATGTTGTTSANLVFSSSPTFTGTVTIPTPFTLGAVSVTTTGTQLNYLSSAGGTTGTTSTNVVFSTSPTLVTPVLGVATATSLNGNTFTTGTYTLTGQAGKTLTFNGSITLTGTDAQTYTFPTTSATLARTDAANTFTGIQTFSSAPVLSTATLTANSVTHTFPSVAGTVTDFIESTTGSSSTPAPTGDSRVNWYQLTALNANATFAAPSGTPANHNELYIRILDATVAKTLAWNAIYRASSDLPLPTTTVASKTMYLKFVYNSASTTWDFLGFLNNF